MNISTCNGFRCQHNGTCFLSKAISGKLQPECRCPDSNYEGRLCELDKCESKYCKNGGKGFRQEDTGVCQCLCLMPFTGPRCDDRLSDSVATACGDLGPCQNGGQCKFVNYCDCPLDYIGPLCNTYIGVGSNPCRDIMCANNGICVVDTNSLEASCVCDSIYSGSRCNKVGYTHCLHGGSLTTGSECVCPEGFHGSRCEHRESVDTSLHQIDNTAINSLTITIVSVSIVSVALVGAVIYLVYFTTHRRISSPFRHRRMEDGGSSNNMEFSNRMFLQDENAEGDRTEPSRNFVNPVYETMFQECQAPIIKPTADLSSLPSTEQATLLCQDKVVVGEGEESGLLRGQQTPPLDRVVIHTDSD